MLLSIDLFKKSALFSKFYNLNPSFDFPKFAIISLIYLFGYKLISMLLGKEQALKSIELP